MIRVLLLVIGYCLGMIQTGYLYGRMKGIDIRKAGSGNSGATNSLRVLGKKAGLIVFAVDLCKCFIPCLIVKAWAVSSGQQHMEDIYMLYLAFGVILGHNYPCYLNFKGGKGISCTSGLILAFDLRIAAVCLAAFSVIVGTTRYVSLGSLTVVSICFVMGVIFDANGMLSRRCFLVFQINIPTRSERFCSARNSSHYLTGCFPKIPSGARRPDLR